ncbi:hypothetical protein U732_1102 [Clostridium argentinense CDC 2741]|uniref:Uncharacterized protein n=1 Tax=Clostridium argentinense CDC 2741 TaxID=1418104 RepID=A0A0C1R1P4_9CLOT|nr:hypothetical protein [Clostridium argentinense]ARC85659.1 hypothetical protein RSJ17_14660 [Clostridium argentinense]KIE47357.1 hypothetical protein U732_1102 [Clostridium argentinense CDC 2741]NFF40818.1 hypothetical protein [Clostridium argentinense]NFP50750.1 hypothetical protein [Clostridium argentinense]NFP73093.1 hypothetical protein [Clostridium argentinense]
MTIRIIFHTGETYFDIKGFKSVSHLLAEHADKYNLYLSKYIVTTKTMIPIAEKIVIPLTSIKMYYEI